MKKMGRQVGRASILMAAALPAVFQSSHIFDSNSNFLNVKRTRWQRERLARMLKALKKGLKKRLAGSNGKLQEKEELEEVTKVSPAAPVPALAAAAAEPAAPPAPAPARLPPRPPAQHAAPAAEGGHSTPAPASAATASATATEKLQPHVPAPAGPPSPPAPTSAAEPLPEGSSVDYELVAGPLELDCSAPDTEARLAGQRGCGQHGSAADVAQHTEHGEVCYEGGAGLDPSGDLGAEEAAGAQAALAEGGGDGQADAASGGDRGGDSAAGPSTEAEPISDALATMMYLTEHAEGQDDCVSVVSGGCCGPGPRVGVATQQPRCVVHAPARLAVGP